MLKLIAQFILSGTVVVLATVTAQKLGQKWAGLIVAIPLYTILAFVFLSVSHPNTNYRTYLISALAFMVPAAIFIACLLLFSGKLQIWANLLASFILFAVSAAVVAKIIR